MIFDGPRTEDPAFRDLDVGKLFGYEPKNPRFARIQAGRERRRLNRGQLQHDRWEEPSVALASCMIVRND